MADPVFGLSITRVNTEPRPASVGDMSVVGLVGTAPGANPLTFPLNTPVLMFSDDSTMLTALGTTGTLPDAVQGVNDQLGDFQVAAKIVIVRVAAGVDDNATITNIVGSQAAKSGIWALPEAGPLFGVMPRLIGVPGFTRQQQRGIGAINITSRGTGYTSPPTVGFTGGTGSGAVVSVSLTNGITLAVGSGGTGYTVAPTVVIDPPPSGGIQAVATATVASGAVTGFTVSEPGTGYVTAPNVTLVPNGGGTGATVTVGLTGRIGTVNITNGGVYTLAPTATTLTGGGGTGATLAAPTLDDLSNAVVAALPPVLSRLLGVAVCDGPTDTYANFLAWREVISSDRIIPIASGVKVGVSGTPQSAVPRVLGIAVRRDYEGGGVPGYSWANQPIQGITGVQRAIAFSLTDDSTEGQQLLLQNAGIVLRGEAGIETAIASSGYIFVGTDTASADPLWQFYNVVRMRDYIHLMFLKTLRFYLGRFNITLNTVETILSTMKLALRDLQADEWILGYKVGFTRDQNSPEQLRLGRITVDFAAEEAPVLRFIGIRSSRYRPALDALLTDLAAQIDVSA